MKIIKQQINDFPSEYQIKEDTEITIIHESRNNQSIDRTIFVTHSTPNCKSRIRIRAVMYDYAKLNLNIVVKISKGAVLTDTFLDIKTLMMSENAFANIVPSLEILESEVKGGHGAVIGYLDHNQINYLISKGLDNKTSEQLLIKAFLRS